MPKWRIISICVCMLSLVLSMHAQSVSDIKNSLEYVWGEGAASTTEAAEQEALGQMSRSISVTIYNKTAKSESNGESVQERVLQSVSSTRLQNVQIRILEEEPNAKVFCFMHRSEVEKIFSQREERIHSLIATGRKAEKRLQIDEAIRNYYWALVLARTMPNDVTIELYEDRGSCLALLPTKIKSIFSLISIKVENVIQEPSRTIGHLRFKYGGRNVATLQFSYFDGQMNLGPVVVRDGFAEIELQPSAPIENVKLRFETRFKNEAENLDPELRAAFTSKHLPIIKEANVAISMFNAAQKKKKSKDEKKVQENQVAAAGNTMKPEPVADRQRIEMHTAANPNDFLPSVGLVEKAISEFNSVIAKKCFTTEGYQMFDALLNRTGKVSLTGQSKYEFVNGNGQILARFCKIKIAFRNGRTFMENMVMRFNPQTKKIESIALALTKKAEDDIFNAAATTWPEVSRYTILNFMEDYQTAYALKRLDYLEKIFSENALIITGTVLTPSTPKIPHPEEGSRLSIGENKNVVYTKLTKEQFIKRLKMHFASREYIHLRFEDNTSHSINTQGQFPKGTVFGIQIRQIYDSPSYSDKGYLTLMLNLAGASPSIEVRLWQPLEDKPVDLDGFFSNDNFKFN